MEDGFSLHWSRGAGLETTQAHFPFTVRVISMIMTAPPQSIRSGHPWSQETKKAENSEHVKAA